jgi:serine/threonine-protein kinase
MTGQDEKEDVDPGSASDSEDDFLREAARAEPLAPPHAKPVGPGDRIAHFRVRSKLGEGGMGVVYAADDEKLRRIVALKVLPSIGQAAKRARFLREARSAAAVSHPNVATIYEVGEDEGRVYIAMEYLRGASLRAHVSERLPTEEVQRVARGIATALARAHAQGVVHRDLKPDNVMLTEEGVVKVLDFGLATAPTSAPDVAEVEPTLTAEGQILGTPSYMSPEQAKGRALDARTDVFSCGVMLYELATGRRPFTGQGALEILVAIERDAPVPPSRLEPRVPPSLEAVILRCLEKNPAARYPDGGALLEALTKGETPTPPSHVSPPVRRARSRLGLVLLASLAIGVVAVGTTWGLRARAPQPSTSAAATSAAPSVTTLTALPAPSAASPEALSAFRAGQQAFHDGMYREAVHSLRHAVEVEPSFAAAHLRLALLERWFDSRDDARASFQRATLLRTDLSERDRALLDAAEPVVTRQPYDAHEAERRFLALVQRYPGDVEIRYWAASVYEELGDFEAIGKLCDQITTMDPGFGGAWNGCALGYAYLGRPADARHSTEECRRISPVPGGCAFQRSIILDDAGDCEQAEADAREWIAASPDSADAYDRLAEVLRGEWKRPRGLPRPVGASAARRRGRRAAPRRGEARLRRGGLRHGASEVARGRREAHGGERRGRPHAGGDAARAALLEAGDAKGAAAIADAFMRKRDAWQKQPSGNDGALFHDPVGMMLRAQLEGGELTRDAYAAARDAWVADLTARTNGFYKRQVWAWAYGQTALDAADGADAMSALASYLPLPPFYWFPVGYGATGKAFALASRWAEAEAPLRKALANCHRRDPRDHHFLGLVLEGEGDVAGACKEHAAVLAAWGAARPASVTARASREKMKALKCP